MWTLEQAAHLYLASDAEFLVAPDSQEVLWEHEEPVRDAIKLESYESHLVELDFLDLAFIFSQLVIRYHLWTLLLLHDHYQHFGILMVEDEP